MNYLKYLNKIISILDLIINHLLINEHELFLIC